MHSVTETARPGVWTHLTAAPHRMMFFGGAFQLLATLLFWSIELAGRYTPLWPPLITAVPTTWAHGFLMVYTLFPFFIFGFLMTTYPRWMDGPPVERRDYVTAFLLLFGGALVFYLGLFAGRVLLAAGVALYLAGWAWGIVALLRVFRAAPARDKHYERWLNLGHILGWLGAACFLVSLAWPRWELVNLAFRAGLWLFLVPLFFTVAHRMVPFFSYCVLTDYEQIRSRWGLPVVWGGLALHGLLEYCDLIAWTWLVDLPLAAVVLWHSFQWKIGRSFQIRLLAVLHVGVFMLGVALVSYAVRSLWLLATGTDLLGLAPQHLLAIGFLTTMVIGMATRVSLGHSGHELVMDTRDWLCFWGIIAAAVLRALGGVALWDNMVLLNLVAGLLWLLSAAVWVARYLPIYWRPRVDGKPG